MPEEAKAIEEAAKATQEVAKFGGKAIDATRDVGGWLDRIFGNAIEHTVGRYWTDRIMARRIEAAIFDWEKLTRLLHNTERKLRTKGIDLTRVVPPKIMLPLLESATIEHEEELRDLWENLLVSALDPSEEEVRRAFISVLSELSGRDAHAFRIMYSEWRYWKTKRPFKEEDRYESGISPNDNQCAALFYRLGLILPVRVVVEEYRKQSPVTQNNSSRHDPAYYVEGGEVLPVLGDLSVVAFTELGERFGHATMGDVSGLYRPSEK